MSLTKMSLLVCLIVFVGCVTSEDFINKDVDLEQYTRIAVLPLTDFKDAPGSGAQVADLVSMNLVQSNLKIVDRSETEKVLAEQGLGLSGMVDEDTAPEVGNLLGVQAILTGNINEWGTTSKDAQLIKFAPSAMVHIAASGITLKLIDCETGQVIWAGSARASTYGENMEFDASKKAVAKVLKSLLNRLD